MVDFDAQEVVTRLRPPYEPEGTPRLVVHVEFLRGGILESSQNRQQMWQVLKCRPKTEQEFHNEKERDPDD